MKHFEYLENIDLHDAPVKSFIFDFESKTISFQVLLYSEKKNDYDILEILFQKVHELQLADIIIKDMKDVDVFDLEIIENANRLFSTKISLNTGFGNGVSVVSFNFSELLIVQPSNLPAA